MRKWQHALLTITIMATGGSIAVGEVGPSAGTENAATETSSQTADLWQDYSAAATDDGSVDGTDDSDAADYGDFREFGGDSFSTIQITNSFNGTASSVDNNWPNGPFSGESSDYGVDFSLDGNGEFLGPDDTNLLSGSAPLSQNKLEFQYGMQANTDASAQIELTGWKQNDGPVITYNQSLGKTSDNYTGGGTIHIDNEGGTQSVSVSGTGSGGVGSAPDFKHMMVAENVIVDFNDIDGDGHIMEFPAFQAGSNHYGNISEARKTLEIASGLTNSILDINVQMDPTSMQTANETAAIFNTDNGDTQLENMKQLYVPVTMSITDNGTGQTTTVEFGLARTPALGDADIFLGELSEGGGYSAKGNGKVDYQSWDDLASGEVISRLGESTETTYDPDLWQVALPGDANRDGDVDVFQFDGNGDAQILGSNVGTTSGASWGDGDFNGDGDVDVFQFDGGGDAQILGSNLGIAYADLGDDAATGTAELVYDVTTGEVWFDIGGAGELAVVGLELQGAAAGSVITANANDLNGTNPGQNDGTVLAYFDFNGLPDGEDSVGLVLPTGLSQSDIGFSYTPLGGQSVQAPVTIVPEPTSIALLGLGGLALLRRRRA